MLSFLREQGSEQLPAEKQDAAASGAPGDDRKPQEQEYLTVAAHGRRTRKSTISLAVLFIVGLFCLWFMIKKSAPQATSAATAGTEDTQVEAAIARLTGVKSEMFNKMDEIVKKFYEFSDVLQVQVSELVKNPFRLELLLAGVKEEPDAGEKAPEIDVGMVWQQQIRQKAKDMQLLSIMQSDQGVCCMIDNKILYEGDSIEDFKVRQIGDSFVKLEWSLKPDQERLGTQSNSVEIVLRLSE